MKLSDLHAKNHYHRFAYSSYPVDLLSDWCSNDPGFAEVIRQTSPLRAAVDRVCGLPSTNHVPHVRMTSPAGGFSCRSVSPQCAVTRLSPSESDVPQKSYDIINSIIALCTTLPPSSL
jgi:hypothetical protein